MSTPDQPKMPPQLETELRALIDAQRKIEAIKRYREHFPQAGLAEAKQVVEALEQSPPVKGSAGSSPTLGTTSSAKCLPGITPEQEARLVALLHKGPTVKIAAIKQYRDWAPGVGLAEAKTAIEMLAQRHGIPMVTGGCFVATAVFGGAEAPEVEALRRWRDTRLVLTPVGRAFIGVYRFAGPKLAIIPERSRMLRALLQRALRWLAHRVAG